MSITYLVKILGLTRLPALPKSLLVHMADQADRDGVVRTSVRVLARLTGMSERTVQRTRDWLVAHQRLQLVSAGGGREQARYRVLVPGVSESQGCQADTGVSAYGPGVSHSRVSDPFTVPTSKEGNAEPAARSRSVENRQPPEMPTRNQVTKLVHLLIDDPGLFIESRGDLEELVRVKCATVGYLYNTPVVQDGINRALAARGFDPRQTVDFEQVRGWKASGGRRR